jgi:hypothetical protein
MSTAASPSVARHETFALRDGWLAKAIDAIERDPASLSRVGAHHDLGVGKNMLVSLRYWTQATGLAESSGRQSLTLTELGKLVKRADWYIEDAGTLWILQRQLACNSQLATFWYWMFNEIAEEEVSEGDAVVRFQQWVARAFEGADEINEKSIRKDWSCFTRTYVSNTRDSLWEDLQSPFAVLGLVDRTGTSRLRLRIGRKPDIPMHVFAWACARFILEREAGGSIASLDELRWGPRSPGRVFCLDTRALAELVDLLVVQKWARVTGTVGIRTIHFDLPDQSALLEDYYELRNGN